PPADIDRLSLHDALPICPSDRRQALANAARPRATERSNSSSRSAADSEASRKSRSLIVQIARACLPSCAATAYRPAASISTASEIGKHTSELQSRENIVC